jgi:hypothetical protein
MVELTGQGRPLTEAMTTRQLMMTTALKELYGLLDAVEIDNDGNYFDTFRPQHRQSPIIVGAAQGPIPLEQTLDPASPRYMHWYDPDVATEETIPECQQDPVSLAPSALVLHFLLLGSVEGRRLASGAFCPGFPGTPRGPQLTAADFEDWTMVTLRPPAPGEPVTPFYDLPALRRARELVLAQPRLGFFTTPAFFANWPTNTSNQMRVTVNQALIVATGASVDTAPATAAPDSPGLDGVHSRDAACRGCHVALDPTRSIFASTFSWHYHTQRDPAWAAQRGLFSFGGVVAPVATLADFGEVLARHPLVAPGWTQKLCQYVTSSPCDERDPELQRVVERFRASGLSWRTLVQTLLTSRLVTAAGAPGGPEETVSVARRDHLCAALEGRLGLSDPCGLAASGLGEPTTIARIATGLPSDAYGRGSVLPILPTDPTLFFVGGVENICKELAPLVIDAPGRRWTSADADGAIAGFVANLMGLGALDPRAARARALLVEHFRAAAAQPGVTARDALQSTFVVACQAPSVLSVGL